ncbi:putative amidohydrolase [Cytophagales bacterium WSM2-2]|nr:putative amidohydrolase [Cytophagales bacterium WSM2-2]
MKYITIILVFLGSRQNFAQTKNDNAIDKTLPGLIAAYRQIHAAPELSGHETQTAALIAAQLKSLGYEVTENIGKFQGKPWKGYGVVGHMKNGKGPVVLVRTEMDALPLTEKTSLPFASTVKVKNDVGEETGVMHACGHDIHMAVFLGVAKILADSKDQWHGELLLVAQPAEEAGPGGSGAEAMLNDGLYTRFPQPDFIVGLHQTPALVAGQVALLSGYSNAVSGAGEIIVRGVGAHPARPQESKDPVVISAELILALQTIVSRETNPFDPVSLTIGVIQGGTAANIVPEEVHMKFNIRALSNEVYDKTIASVTRMANGVAITAGVPDNRMPIVTSAKGYPANYNDPVLTERILRIFKKVMGENNVLAGKPLLTGEDFSYYSLDKKIPSLFFNIGSSDPLRYAESLKTGVALPFNHSPMMIPVADLTIKTGVKAMTSAVFELFK